MTVGELRKRLASMPQDVELFVHVPGVECSMAIDDVCHFDDDADGRRESVVTGAFLTLAEV